MLQTEDDLLHGQMSLTSHTALILTDSEGLQEEGVILGVPCITLRENTERPITVAVGANQVVGNKPAAIIEAVQTRLSQSQTPFQPPEKWNGLAARRIVEILITRSSSFFRLTARACSA
jgi:UDP-N-acetylglucosamine 2-epimerase (non-hydrolysing)